MQMTEATRWSMRQRTAVDLDGLGRAYHSWIETTLWERRDWDDPVLDRVMTGIREWDGIADDVVACGGDGVPPEARRMGRWRVFRRYDAPLFRRTAMCRRLCVSICHACVVDELERVAEAAMRSGG